LFPQPEAAIWLEKSQEFFFPKSWDIGEIDLNSDLEKQLDGLERPSSGSLLQDVIQRLDRIQGDLNRSRSQRIPDRFLPLNEAVLQMHCGKDWVKGKIADGSLRAGIDFMDRSSPESKRRRYLVNPRSAQAWLNLSSKTQKNLRNK